MDTIFAQMNRIKAAIEAVIADNMPDCTASEVYVLRELMRHDGQRAGELADTIGRARTAFTPVLDALEKKGYIERQEYAHDRRSVLIKLTPAGKRLNGQIANIWMDAEQAGRIERDGEIPF